MDPRVLEFVKEDDDPTADDAIIRLLPTFEHYKALERKCEERIKQLRDRYESTPKINTEEVRHDIRYQLGFVQGISWVLRQPYKPDKIITEGIRK